MCDPFGLPLAVTAVLMKDVGFCSQHVATSEHSTAVPVPQAVQALSECYSELTPGFSCQFWICIHLQGAPRAPQWEMVLLAQGLLSHHGQHISHCSRTRWELWRRSKRLNC